MNDWTRVRSDACGVNWAKRGECNAARTAPYRASLGSEVIPGLAVARVKRVADRLRSRMGLPAVPIESGRSIVGG